MKKGTTCIIIISFIVVVIAILVGVLQYLQEDPQRPINAMDEEVMKWKRQGKMINSFGWNIWTRIVEQQGRDHSNATLLILHGFPSSSWDFRMNLDALQKRFSRIVLFDHLGLGFSDKPENFTYSLIDYADVTLDVWRQLGITNGHLLAHDIGDSIATELLTRVDRELLPAYFDGFQSVTFLNGGMHIEDYAPRISQLLLLVPYIGDFLAHNIPPFVFKKQLQTIVKHLSDEEMEYMWRIFRDNGGHLASTKMISYISDRRRFQNFRWLASWKRLSVPCHILWGIYDTVSPTIIGEKIHAEIPNSKLTLLNWGHYAMIESPQEWNQAFLSFF